MRFVNRKRTKIVEWTLNTAAMAAMTTTTTKENMQTDHIMWGTCTVLYIRQILSNPLCINKIVSSGISDSTIAAVDSKLQTQKNEKRKKWMWIRSLVFECYLERKIGKRQQRKTKNAFIDILPKQRNHNKSEKNIRSLRYETARTMNPFLQQHQ